jgi:hypothetical protein
MYYEDKQTYPTFTFPFGGKLCETSACAETEKVYMQKVPNDPISGKDYQYVSSDGTNYKIFACLENNQQILPYESSDYTLTCGNCKNQIEADVPCIWGISSTNISP